MPPLSGSLMSQCPGKCQSIYIKATVHEITSMSDRTPRGVALGYSILSPESKENTTLLTIDLSVTPTTYISINQYMFISPVSGHILQVD